MHGPLSALFRNNMNSIKYIVSVAALTAALTLSARANFIVDPNPDGVKMYNDFANHNVSAFEGFVGANNSSLPHIDIATTGKVDTGSGFSTIKPTNNRTTLTQLIFTPENGDLFNGFSFRGQLKALALGTVTVIVQDNQGNAPQTFTFTGLGANSDFARIGVIASDNETIQSITLISNFKEVKQIEWNLAPGQVPDGGATVMLLGAALSGLGIARRFFKS